MHCTTVGEILPAFQPVEVVIEESSRVDSGVERVLRDGRRASLCRGFDVQVLEELLRALGAAC